MAMKPTAAILIIVALSGCAQKPHGEGTDSGPDANKLWKEYSASLNAGDAERWIALWTEDGVQMPPDEPAVVGKARLRDRIRAALDRFRFDMAISNEEVRTAGDMAFARGTYTATLTPKGGGQPIPIDGKFMTILLRQPDGSWKIHRDIFNSNAPPTK
jgi:uncharacterized protein (TIGR02246 family)